jgi:hypothetical protein
MFGRSRTQKAQSVAEDAWDALVSSWESARDRTGDLMGDTQDRLGSVTDEARRRAGAALDALAGHRPGRPWGLLLAAVAAGAAVGWIAAAAMGRAPALESIDETTDADSGVGATG